MLQSVSLLTVHGNAFIRTTLVNATRFCTRIKCNILTRRNFKKFEKCKKKKNDIYLQTPVDSNNRTSCN